MANRVIELQAREILDSRGSILAPAVALRCLASGTGRETVRPRCRSQDAEERDRSNLDA
jgi:hypothetical protein